MLPEPCHPTTEIVTQFCRESVIFKYQIATLNHLKTVRTCIVALLTLLLGNLVVAQAEPTPDEGAQFSKFLLEGGQLYALDRAGLLHVWDVNTKEKVFVSPEGSATYSALARDNNGGLFLGSEKGRIYRLNPADYSVEEHLKLKKSLAVREMFFNSNNELFLIVPNAVYDPVRNKAYREFPFPSIGVKVHKPFLFVFNRRVRKHFSMPQYTYLDSQDRIWMTSGMGEFGGIVQIFDTRKRKELHREIGDLDYEMLFPQSVFEGPEQSIIITSGLQHFMNFGEILQVEEMNASSLYDSHKELEKDSTARLDDGLFVGPGAFHAPDNQVYFATNKGIYRASLSETDQPLAPELLFQPQLRAEREPLAIGMKMAVLRMEVTPENDLVFLTARDGIGLYKDEELTMLK